MSDYPHTCPACTSPAYIGLVNNIECSSRGCDNYVAPKPKCGKPSCNENARCTTCVPRETKGIVYYGQTPPVHWDMGLGFHPLGGSDA